MEQRKSQAGVSLAELMIAMAVILIGMSGVAASLYFGFRSSASGDNIAVATQHARTLIEVATGRNYNDSGLYMEAGTGLPSATSGMNDPVGQAPRALDAPPFTATDFPPALQVGRDFKKYKRTITLSRRGAVGTADQFQALMTVTIHWEEKGVKKSVSTAAIIPHSALPN